jgi:hypothetical protein
MIAMAAILCVHTGAMSVVRAESPQSSMLNIDCTKQS